MMRGQRQANVLELEFCLHKPQKKEQDGSTSIRLAETLQYNFPMLYPCIPSAQSPPCPLSANLYGLSDGGSAVEIVRPRELPTFARDYYLSYGSV